MFSLPRDFHDQRFVYTVVSARARGLSVGVNLNPDKFCNFDCQYCEVDRSPPVIKTKLDVRVLTAELQATLERVVQGRMRERPAYQNVPAELLRLQHVALSGDGEPTLSPEFAEVVEAVIHVRAVGEFPFFKMVLLTNAAGLDLPPVQRGLAQFTQSDEIWIKLDAGTPAYFNQLARPKDITFEKVLANLLLVARQRSVVIQSLFPAINNEPPAHAEIAQYAQRLKELKNAGAQISLVQIYSSARPTWQPHCGHLPLKTLSRIAQTVRQETGLKAEIF